LDTRKYDLYSDEFRATTYETFAQMRTDDPVFCSWDRRRR
jgi:hypothetical protein